MFIWLGKVAVDTFGQGSILKSVGTMVVGGQGQNVHLVHFGLHEVLEGAVLLARLALVPILGFRVAHPRGEFFGLDALGHALVEGVAGVCCETHRVERFHN